MNGGFGRASQLRFAARGLFFWCLLAAGESIPAAQLREATVTRIVQDVELLPGERAARPAVLQDRVLESTAVRTGTDSRTELTFTDQTLARLGANTLFSFREGTRDLNLGGGVMLLQVPKNSGGARISTAAVSAAITGTTVMLEYHPHFYLKFIVLEGIARIYLRNRLGESVLVHAGQMLIVNPDARNLPDAIDIDLERLLATSLLITDFPPLASEQLLRREVRYQREAKVRAALIETNLVIYGRGTLVTLLDPPPLDTLDLRKAAFPSAITKPLEVGPLTTITSTVPYLINSGTSIVTAPTITTNGIVDHGKIYRGVAQDGDPAAYLFGSTSSFDQSSGFDGDLKQNANLPLAAFRFSSLQLTGNPTITVPPTGASKLALVSVGDLTSGPPGGTLSFSNLDTLILATVNGSITLTPDVSFSGLQLLIFYARGAASNLTLGSPVTGVALVKLDAERSIQVNAAENVNDFRAVAGLDFLDGTGHVVASNINIIAGNDINFTSSDFGVPVGSTTNVFLQAANNANLDVRDDQSVFANANSTFIQGSAINVATAPGGTTTLIFRDFTPVQFTAGAGGIQAPQINFFQTSFGMEFQSVGNIVANSIGGADTLQSTAGSIQTTSNIIANQVSAGLDIISGGDLTAINSVTAGNNVSAKSTLLSPTVTAGGNITASHVEVQNINPLAGGPTNTFLTAGAGGITPLVTASGAALPHVFNVLRIVSPGGINFSGDHFGPGANGGLLTINAQSLDFSATGVNGVNFDGAPVPGANTGPGNGGLFTVNTLGNITATTTKIEATSGMININGTPAGAGGTVNLNSASGTIGLANSSILVSSADPLGTANRHSSASGGHVTLHTNLTSGTGITIDAGSSIQSLLEPTAPGPGGTILLSTKGANIVVNGMLRADKGTITISQNDPPTQIPLLSLDSSQIFAENLNVVAAGDLSFTPTAFTATTISLFALNNLTWNGGTVTSTAANSDGNITMTAGQGFLVTSDADITQRASGRPSGVNVLLTAGSDLTANGHLNITALNPGANNLNSGANITLHSGADLNVNDQLGLFVTNQDGATIGTGANVSLTADGNISAKTLDCEISNNGATIGTGGNMTVATAGDLTTTGDAKFLVVNQNGIINSNPTVSVHAADFTIGGNFYAFISNTGTIGAGDGGKVNVTADAALGVTGILDVNGTVTAGGEIDAGTLSATNVSTTANVVVQAGGITFFQDFTGHFFNGPYMITAAGLKSAAGVLLNGDIIGPGVNGGMLTIKTATLDFSTAGVNGANLDGAAAPTNSPAPGDGGTLNVNSTGDINVNGVNITARTGIIDTNGVPAGTGGNVSLTSTNGQITMNNATIQVSSKDAVGSSNRRSSAKGGNIALQSDLPAVTAISISNTSQLLSLLDGVAPGPGGKITIKATGSTSIMNVDAKLIEADGGLVDIRHTNSGVVSLTNATVSADIVKIAALGADGTLLISGGSISADTMLKLYAPGSAGMIDFSGTVTLNGSSVKILAANTIKIDQNGRVIVGGQSPVDVYTTHAIYSAAFGGDGTTNGTFAGKGANMPKPLPSAPPLD